MEFAFPLQVNTAITLLNEAGYSAYVVGGAVRDLVMGKAPHDWDITTSARPEETEKVFEGFRIIETGMKHGTVTVLIDSMPLEITTYRLDGDYTDRRRPDTVLFAGSVLDDLSRRDFTCNALACHPETGVINEYGGIDDIAAKIIRCVGEADVRFNEDALRILRALRFASVLGFEIEKSTADSIRRNYRLLEYVSAERVFTELTKLLCGASAGRILREFSEVIFFILPELEPMKGCEQSNIHHIYDVWGHTVASVESIAPDPVLRMTMLLHDCGKPECKTVDENGVDHFYGHDKISAEKADAVLRRLRASNSFRYEVTALCELHGFVPDKISKKTYKKYIGRYGESLVRRLFEVRMADASAQNPAFSEEALEANRRGLEILNEILTDEPCFGVTDLAIGGRELMAEGFGAGKRLGEVLGILLDEVMDGKIKNEKSALIARAKELL